MKWFLLLMEILAFNLYHCACQDIAQIKFDLLHEVHTTVKNLDSRTQAIEARLDAFEAIEARLDAIEGQVSSWSSQGDLLKNAFAELIAEERQEQREMLKDTCSRSQVETLQHLLAVDECLEGTDNCSANANCYDAQIGFRCVCREGFTGDGINCQILCEAPGHVIEGLGCIIPVKEKLSFDNASTNCRTKYGGRLVEGLSSQAQLDEIDQRFRDFFEVSSERKNAWVGVRRRPGEDYPIKSDSPLWRHEDGQPHKGSEECADTSFPASSRNTRPSLGDFYCSHRKFSLCQKYA